MITAQTRLTDSLVSQTLNLAAADTANSLGISGTAACASAAQMASAAVAALLALPEPPDIVAALASAELQVQKHLDRYTEQREKWSLFTTDPELAELLMGGTDGADDHLFHMDYVSSLLTKTVSRWGEVKASHMPDDGDHEHHDNGGGND